MGFIDQVGGEAKRYFYRKQALKCLGKARDNIDNPDAWRYWLQQHVEYWKQYHGTYDDKYDID